MGFRSAPTSLRCEGGCKKKNGVAQPMPGGLGLDGCMYSQWGALAGIYHYMWGLVMVKSGNPWPIAYGPRKQQLSPDVV